MTRLNRQMHLLKRVSTREGSCMNAHALGERLFYQNPWLKQADAVIKAIEYGSADGFADSPTAKTGAESLRVMLDTTIFYPEGGGQPPDTGFIDDLRVYDVQEIDGHIWHFVELSGNPGSSLKPDNPLKPGDHVHLSIDWQRRLDHMQQHTGQHLLSAVLEQEYGVHTLSFHLGTLYSTIDISAKNPEELPLPDIEAKVEDLIVHDVSVLIHYCPPEDIAAFRLRKKPPADEAVIRVVEIEGYDWSPCGGTHVERTEQLRAIKILSLERYKGNVRLYFAAGARAVRLLSAAYEETRKAASVLGVGIGEISARASDILGKIASLEGALKKSTQTWAAAEAKLAASRAAPREVLEFRLDDDGADSAAELAKAAADLGRAAIAISLSDKTIIVQVPKAQGTLSLAGMLKPKLAEFGGKGGGGPAFFRASFSSESELARFAEEAKRILGSSHADSQHL